MTWTLTGFADESGPELDLQVDTLRAESMRYLELRSAWGTNVVDLDDAQVTRLVAELDAAGIKVSAIGSPVGKSALDTPVEAELERLRRAAAVAERTATELIRVFSFFIPAGEPPERYRSEVLDRMGALAEEAVRLGVVLAHENEKRIYGDVPERCVDLLREVDSPALRSTFDAGNFVQCGVRPYTEAYPRLRPYLAYIQIKDVSVPTGRAVPAGQGDGEIPETLAALWDSGFDGFFSLEPHLAQPDVEGRPPELFRTAVQALKRLLDDLSVPWV